MIGGPEQDRTADLYAASVALSQLSYRPSQLRLVESKDRKVFRGNQALFAGRNSRPTLNEAHGTFLPPLQRLFY